MNIGLSLVHRIETVSHGFGSLPLLTYGCAAINDAMGRERSDESN